MRNCRMNSPNGNSQIADMKSDSSSMCECVFELHVKYSSVLESIHVLNFITSVNFQAC